MSEYHREKKTKDIINGLKKLGFEIRNGKRHDTATCPKTHRKTMIPRHKIITASTVKSICEFLIKNGYTEGEVKRAFKL